MAPGNPLSKRVFLSRSRAKCGFAAAAAFSAVTFGFSPFASSPPRAILAASSRLRCARRGAKWVSRGAHPSARVAASSDPD